MKILVIGDSCHDVFVYGKCDRICPEAPVPVFTPIETKTNGGMARNVYYNIKSLVKEDIEVSIVTNTNLITKTRYVDYKTNQIVLTTPCSSDYYIYVRKNEVLALHLYDKVDATREIITTFPDNSQLNNVFESKSNLYYSPTGPCVVTIRPINYK